MNVSLANSVYMELPSSFLKPHLHLCLETQMHKPIVCARNRRRQFFFGSAKSRKLMFESAYLIASKLKILPEPLNLMIREYAGGSGGGGGGGVGGGGSGFSFWRGGFDGWGRRKKRKWNFWGVLVICGILGAWLILGRELEFDVFWGGLGLLSFGISVNGWWMSGFKDWALGFCCCAVLLGWALKRDDLQRWVKSIGPLKTVGRRRRRRTRSKWAFLR